MMINKKMKCFEILLEWYSKPVNNNNDNNKKMNSIFNININKK